MEGVCRGRRATGHHSSGSGVSVGIRDVFTPRSGIALTQASSSHSASKPRSGIASMPSGHDYRRVAASFPLSDIRVRGVVASWHVTPLRQIWQEESVGARAPAEHIATEKRPRELLAPERAGTKVGARPMPSHPKSAGGVTLQAIRRYVMSQCSSDRESRSFLLAAMPAVLFALCSVGCGQEKPVAVLFVAHGEPTTFDDGTAVAEFWDGTLLGPSGTTLDVPASEQATIWAAGYEETAAALTCQHGDFNQNGIAHELAMFPAGDVPPFFTWDAYKGMAAEDSGRRASPIRSTPSFRAVNGTCWSFPRCSRPPVCIRCGTSHRKPLVDRCPRVLRKTPWGPRSWRTAARSGTRPSATGIRPLGSRSSAPVYVSRPKSGWSSSWRSTAAKWAGRKGLHPSGNTSAC